jgi:hypothetical protein
MKVIKALLIFSLLTLAADRAWSEGKAAAARVVAASFARSALTQGTFRSSEPVARPVKRIGKQEVRVEVRTATLRRCDTRRSSSSLRSS